MTDPLTPSWGEPENLMSLAWCSLNKKAPDPQQAEAYARQALALVPDWHYVRDISCRRSRAPARRAEEPTVPESLPAPSRVTASSRQSWSPRRRGVGGIVRDPHETAAVGVHDVQPRRVRFAHEHDPGPVRGPRGTVTRFEEREAAPVGADERDVTPSVR